MDGSMNLINPDEFKGSQSKYAQERKEISQGQDRKDIDYWNSLFSDYDRFKADSNNDGKISFDEYKEYVTTQHNSQIQQSEIMSQNIHENNNNNTYYFDYTLLIAISIVCITTIINTLIKREL